MLPFEAGLQASLELATSVSALAGLDSPRSDVQIGPGGTPVRYDPSN
jgi:hypothetical protein